LKKFALIVGLSLILLTLPMLANATRPEGPPRLNTLSGTKIRLYPGVETESFSSSEVTYVCHGIIIAEGDIPYPGGWSELSPAQKVEFLRTAVFELYVDSVPVELWRTQWYSQEADSMGVWWYATFGPGTFSEGLHSFYAYWHVLFDGEPYTLDNTVEIDVFT
jgi:hypothetical protein